MKVLSMFRLAVLVILAGTGLAAAGNTLPVGPPALHGEPDSEGQGLDNRPGPELWASLTPEERQQMRSQIRDHWRNMPPEGREKRREEMHERWQQMSPEERQQIRDTIREHRDGGRSPAEGSGPGGR
jgi:Spy/CpxP family protein refolding chaperone